MKYECKENDAIIELGKDKEELFISIKKEKAKTVIGLKDLKQALILFGVMFELPDVKKIDLHIKDITDKCFKEHEGDIKTGYSEGFRACFNWLKIKELQF